MLALYLVTLTASAGIVGLFVREVLNAFGLIPTFSAGLIIVVSAAFAYAALQALYFGLLRLVEPTTSWGPYLTEMLSHLAALLLLPYIAGIAVDWPHPMIERLEPLAYFGAFGAVHVFFKLASFYGSLQGEFGNRTWSWGWFGASAVCALLAFVGLNNWLEASASMRPVAPAETTAYRAGGATALARVVPEGAQYTAEMTPADAQVITFRIGALPGSVETATVDRAYVTVALEGDSNKDYITSVTPGAGWQEVQVPPEFVPRNLSHVTMRWSRQATPKWQRVLGIEPVVFSVARDQETPALPAALLVSGPFSHRARPDAEGPNIILLFIDGLRADRLTAAGATSPVAPALDRLANAGEVFTRAYTPTPAASPAMLAALTGTASLSGGYGGTEGPTALEVPTIGQLLRDLGYATAAFTEDAGAGDDAFWTGTGLELGFEWVHSAYEPPRRFAPPPTLEGGEGAAEAGESPEATAERWIAGSSETLEAARNWVDHHQDVKFFLTIRLRDLAALPSSADMAANYDDLLLSLDQHMGAFIKFVRDQRTRNNTAIIITSPYGVVFEDIDKPAVMAPALAEPALHVPLILFAPGRGSGLRKDVVSLEDLAPTIAHLIGMRFPGAVRGLSFLNQPIGRGAVSHVRDPLALSLRTEDYRLTWQPDADGGEGALALYRESSGEWWLRDVQTRNPRDTARLRQELQAYYSSAE